MLLKRLLAIENTKENVNSHHVEDKVEVKYSDLYSNIYKNERFDTIFWNVPFGFVEREGLTMLERSVFDTNYNTIREFIYGAKNYLKDTGRLLIGFSIT